MDSVIVTGASRGLGLAITERLAADGFRVIGVARRSSAELEAAASGEIVFRAFDLSDLAAIPAFVRGIRQEFGAIRGLVNNAGGSREGLLANTPDPEIEALFRLNALSPILLTKYVARGMMADGGGRIVNVSSIMAMSGFNGLAVYGATKAALVGFTKSLARELGKLEITVNAVAPGFIATELTKSLDEVQRKRIADRSALKRLADPKDVAAAVAFLMGPDGRNVTGTVMTIDAGGTA